MSKRTDNILKIIEAGANVIVLDASAKDRENLLRLARAAVENDVHVTIRNTKNFSVETLLAVAEAGGTNVTIEV